MAGERTQFNSFRAVDAARPAVHGRMVALARHKNPGPHYSGRAERFGRGLIGIRLAARIRSFLSLAPVERRSRLSSPTYFSLAASADRDFHSQPVGTGFVVATSNSCDSSRWFYRS